MDPVSQAALGAAWAQAAPRGRHVVSAIVLGAAAGVAADLDTLIRSDTDPLLALEYHRHFTHSLIFIPVGAALCTLLFYPLFRRHVSLPGCYRFTLLGFASHGLLDACTSYGTMLLWPFSDVRVAWNLISVVDPLFTLPLLAALFFSLRLGSSWPTLLGVGWCLCYLVLGLVQQTRVAASMTELANDRGHVDTRITAKPSFANLLVWKTFYEYDGRLYIDAVRAGVSPQVFEGESFARLDPQRDFPWLSEDSRQWQDIQRFLRFADGFVAIDPHDVNRVLDVRYSLVPNRGDGFWGLELDPAAGADVHAAYVTMRVRTVAEGKELLRMIIQGD